MSKKCLKCGCIISDDAVTGYCYNCSKITPPVPNNESHIKKDYGYLREEKVLVVIANIIIFASVIACMLLLYLMSERVIDKFYGFTFMIATVLYSIISWAVLLCIAKASKNIREIRNK